jgi:hypothetical protein
MDKEKVIETMANLEDAFKQNSLSLAFMHFDELEEETGTAFAMECLIKLTDGLDGNTLVETYFKPMIQGFIEKETGGEE